MRPLFGRWFITIDVSRRVSIPQGLLKQLEEQGITSFMAGTPSRLKCVWLIPTSEWPEAYETLAAVASRHVLDEGATSHYARLLGTFQEVPLGDKRITLDETLLTWAGIDPSDFLARGKSLEIIVTAVGRRLELWHKDEFQKQISRDVAPPEGVTVPEQMLTSPEAQSVADGSSRQS